MRTMELTLAILYDEQQNLAMQDRRSKSKFGEMIGYFGGGIEAEETPTAAVHRELEEELRLKPDLAFLGRYERSAKRADQEWLLVMYQYIARIRHDDI